MNIESTTIQTTTVKDSETSTTSSTPKAADKTFKAELEAAKTTEAKASVNDKATITAEAKTSEEAKTAQVKQIEDSNNEVQQAEFLTTQQAQTAQEAVKNNISQQVEKDKTTNDKLNKTSEETAVEKPLDELTSKIATLNELVSNSKTFNSKVDKTSDKDDYCKTMTMDSKDITFFVNLVENKNAQTEQNISLNAQNSDSITLNDVKSEATQQTVQVSATLMDALNNSLQTNKPFRIDFDSDVAVIMKVDKNGVLSANFIPGSAAVEAYLKNNISALQQNFDNQNLAYNELTYSQQQKQEKKEQRNNKENENE